MREKFKKHLQRIRKEQSEYTYDGIMEEIRKSFFYHLSFLPEEMLYDMFKYYIDNYTDAGDVYTDIDRMSEKLLDVTDLFCSNYEEPIGTITDADFEYLKETVNDFSEDLPEDVLFYIMKKAVERGSFHR